ncbi:hypothetical protein [Haloarcula laminariae]|uniref:hypothetical protein n=1 Tax=Haloarcula laminariae TaxID=2961577 RepID=UPI002406BD07|nr:hypothetical protein [Halomicroarcula sp. FL173]
MDTNVWVFAIAGENQIAEELVSDVISGERETVVDTYIYFEVINAFSRSKSISDKHVQSAQDKFGQLIWAECDTIEEAVDENKVNEYCENPEEFLEQRRDSTYDNMLGDSHEIQAKDAPILKLAYEYATHGSQTTIHTNDEDFADFDPSRFNYPIKMNYVPDETETVGPQLKDE